MKRRSAFLFAVLLLPLAAHPGPVTDKFVNASLARGVSVSLPKTWEVLQGNENKALETSVGAALDLSGYSRVLSGGESLLFAAFPDAGLYASVSITAISVPKVTSDFASQFSSADLPKMDEVVRKGVEQTVSRLGSRTWGWSPLKVEKLGKRSVFHTSYLRTAGLGDTRVHLYKFFSSGYVFDVALSTRMSSERVNTPVLERILQSIEVPP